MLALSARLLLSPLRETQQQPRTQRWWVAVREVGVAVLRTDDLRLSTQKPVLEFVFPGAIEIPEGDRTVKRVPERLKVPFHLALSETFVGRSNPADHLETLVAELFFTMRVPHQPLTHLSS